MRVERKSAQTFVPTAMDIRDEVICFMIVITCIIHVTRSGIPCDPCICQFYPALKCSAAFCRNVDPGLSEVPKNLHDYIEYLDLSKNRIKILTARSFVPYSKLKYLLLTDNSLSWIDNGTFSPLTKLTYLDLSANAINILPADLPPSLEKLYLGFLWPSMFRDGEAVLPELESLKVLSLESNNMKTFPKFVRKILNLELLNLSHNPITEFAVEDLASMCNLKTLSIDTEDLFASESSTCDCLKVDKWIQMYGITIEGFACKANNIRCDLTFSNESVSAHEACVSTLSKKDFLHKATIAASILGVIIVIGLLIFWCCCRKKKVRKSELDSVRYHSEKMIEDKPENAYE